MEQFVNLYAKVLPIDIDNVDTDMIIPAQHLTSVSKEGYGDNLFSNLKKLYPDFILNNQDYHASKILLSKENFGCGSSREHAVWAIKQYGIKVVICSSFSDIFFNNAVKNGLLLITLSKATINAWINASVADSSLQMTVDLTRQEISFINEIISFSYDPFRKYCLLNGVDDLDYLLSKETLIKQYEMKQ
jgi:3-isopropylmalate/(R)-2-methylmalate dehydratase small subunit